MNDHAPSTSKGVLPPEENETTLGSTPSEIVTALAVDLCSLGEKHDVPAETRSWASLASQLVNEEVDSVDTLWQLGGPERCGVLARLKAGSRLLMRKLFETRYGCEDDTEVDRVRKAEVLIQDRLRELGWENLTGCIRPTQEQVNKASKIRQEGLKTFPHYQSFFGPPVWEAPWRTPTRNIQATGHGKFNNYTQPVSAAGWSLYAIRQLVAAHVAGALQHQGGFVAGLNHIGNVLSLMVESSVPVGLAYDKSVRSRLAAAARSRDARFDASKILSEGCKEMAQEAREMVAEFRTGPKDAPTNKNEKKNSARRDRAQDSRGNYGRQRQRSRSNRRTHRDRPQGRDRERSQERNRGRSQEHKARRAGRRGKYEKKEGEPERE